MEKELDTPELLREQDVLRYVLDDLASSFPERWRVSTELELQGPVGAGPDAMVTVTAPDGSSARLLVEARVNVEPRTASFLLDQVRNYQLRLEDDDPGTPVNLLVIGRYLAPRTREMLDQAGVSYADATGNMLVRLDRPATWIDREGARSNPWREEREIRTLGGVPAARLVRALCDWSPPVDAVKLSRRALTSTGSTYRLLDFLDREALITREGKGRVLDVEWDGLLRRWSWDYDFISRNAVVSFIEPRSLGRVVERLRETRFRYAITGSFSAATAAEYATPRLASLYVDDVDEAAEALGLRPADRGGNVLLARPFDSVVYERTRSIDDLAFCALSQTAVDLMTSPGRSPEEAEELLRWMAADERGWRL